MAAPSPLALDARWLFVGGKGGVGKTTVAASLAVARAAEGHPVLAISTDPAHSLGDALDTPLGADPAPVPGAPGLSALEVDAALEQRRFLDAHRAAILELAEHGTYLERTDLDGFLRLALPGIDELAAVLRLMRLTDAGEAQLIVDTAPTGHTLRLLALPGVLRRWVAAFAAMQEKHRQVSEALVGRFAPGAGGEFLAALDADLDRLEARLSDPAATRFLLVTNPAPAVAAETRRYLGELRRLGVPLAGVVVNRDDGRDAGLAGVDVPAVVRVPRLEREPRGVTALRGFARSLAHDAEAAAVAVPAEPPAAAVEAEPSALGAPYDPPAGRRLYLVGGKGGVGKTTVAAALAVSLAARGARPLLLLSADPAGSLDEVLGEPVADVESRQLDAAGVWARFRDDYAAAVDRLFEQLLGSLSAGADEQVMRRLIDLAPPGIDEIMALGEVIDALEGGAYNALVLDTAPTGHLLRLLEMPQVGLEWTHALMRLLLKYREVVRAGELGERVLGLARSLRWIAALLGDAERTCMLVVARPEALSVPETRRLLGRLDALGVPVDALLVNRVAGGAESDAHLAALAELAGTVPCAVAPECAAGPRGTAALQEFAGRWRRLRPA